MSKEIKVEVMKPVTCGMTWEETSKLKKDGKE